VFQKSVSLGGLHYYIVRKLQKVTWVVVFLRDNRDLKCSEACLQDKRVVF